MDGTLTLEEGSLYDFLEICAVNSHNAFAHPLGRTLTFGQTLLRRLHQHNPVQRAQANVAHHYDLSDRLYDLFLDSDRQYSCGYFTDPHGDIDQAQHDKKRHLAAKLLLQPGQRILDIGSGWGGLALYLAEAGAAEVVGITLSEQQLAVSRERAQRRGWPTGCASSSATTASRPACSTGSSRWVCSSTSASSITGSSSSVSATCSPRTASPCCTRSAGWTGQA